MANDERCDICGEGSSTGRPIQSQLIGTVHSDCPEQKLRGAAWHNSRTSPLPAPLSMLKASRPPSEEEE